MATATRVEEVVIDGGVTLNLTEEEARFLRDVMTRIGGDPWRSRRRYADFISVALNTAGYYQEKFSDTDARARSIYFEDEK